MMLNSISNIKHAYLVPCFEENVSNELPLNTMLAIGFDNYLLP